MQRLFWFSLAAVPAIAAAATAGGAASESSWLRDAILLAMQAYIASEIGPFKEKVKILWRERQERLEAAERSR